MKSLTVAQKILLVSLLSSVGFWIFVTLTSGYKPGPLAIYTQIPLFVIPLFAGLVGFWKSKGWGGFASRMGRAVYFCSMGAFLFGFGLAMWTYYTAVHAVVPYPSRADYVIVSCMGFWIIGLLGMGSIIGVMNGLKTFGGWMRMVLVLVLMIVVGYFVQITVTGSSLLTILSSSEHAVFDVIYNFGNLVIIAEVAALYGLSSKYLGGKYKSAILFIFLGQMIHYAAVVWFLKGVNGATYFNGDGADLLYTIALFFEGIGIVGLDPKRS